MNILKIISLAAIVTGLSGCIERSRDQGAQYWLTKGDSSTLLERQIEKLPFGTTSNNFPFVDVDSSRTFQTMDGFGYTLTGGSAYMINQLTAADKTFLLRELFGKNRDSSICISYLRISLGASDLNDHVFSYDDMPAGQTDTTLNHFTLDPDKKDLVPLLKEILLINPAIKILSCPWSPPAWMKDNDSTIGGSLEPKYYHVYARYFVKYIQQMKAEGIAVDAITPQNEPLNPKNNPSLLMTADQQTDFIKNHLGPAFKDAGINTKIIIYDHNCDRPDYPLIVLNDSSAKSFVDGSAFHLYAGDISAMSQVHDAHPDRRLYFTEQYTGSEGKFNGDLIWAVKNLIIGASRNWSRNVLEWNLANDASFGPHTPGGCTTCKGALTIKAPSIARNVAYYIIAHASRFVPSGSVCIGSNNIDSVQNVAFKTPSGEKVLIAVNEGESAASFNIRVGNKWATATLSGQSVATYMWE